MYSILIIIILFVAILCYMHCKRGEFFGSGEGSGGSNIGTGGLGIGMYGLNNTRRITLYYADWCGYCREFRPKYELVKQNLKNSGIIFKEVNEKDGQIPPYVAGFPTVEMLDENGNRRIYSGIREPAPFQNWIVSP